jgi:hypothetical protein
VPKIARAVTFSRPGSSGNPLQSDESFPPSSDGKGSEECTEAHPAIVATQGDRVFGTEVVKAEMRLQNSVSVRISDRKIRLWKETEQLQQKQLTIRFSYAQSISKSSRERKSALILDVRKFRAFERSSGPYIA